LELDSVLVKELRQDQQDIQDCFVCFRFPDETGNTQSAIRPRKDMQAKSRHKGYVFFAPGDWLLTVASGNSRRQQENALNPVDPVYK
jgi:hypothetical protein